MKKRGFTLIELLAVIVILAIISLIAVPVILNIIRDAKKSSAKDSAYGYIKAVENYQAMEMLKGNKGLKEGKYNTVSETTIGETKYKKLNDIVSLKGDKPTGGTVTILKNQTVGSAYLCINSYVVEYLNNEANIVSDDCGEMGSIIEFVVDSEDYQINRTLTINYPKGNYEYYYKVSGKAKLNDTYIEKDKEIKTENNVSILLEENQTVEVWMIKNGKKISLRNYVEEKIDNVEIGKIAIKDNTSIYPTLTKDGVKYAVNIELDYEEQEGTSAYYSVDDGITWEKYTKSVTKNVSSGKIKAKMVRDKSKREGNIVEKKISLASDALGINAYDNDTTTYLSTNNNKNYIGVDSSMIGKKIKFNITLGDSEYPAYLDIIDKTGSIINTVRVNENFEFTIPENTTMLNYRPYNAWDKKDKFYEIIIIDNPIINVESSVNAKITQVGITSPYNYISINYFENLNKKLYKINDGEWKLYNGKFKTNIGDKIIAKGIFSNGKETKISEFNSEIINTIPKVVYDNDTTTYLSTNNNKNYIDVDSSMIGKKIKFNITLGDSEYPAYLDIIDKTGSIINTVRVNENFEFTIPENTTMLNYRPYNAWDKKDKLYEISIIK